MPGHYENPNTSRRQLNTNPNVAQPKAIQSNFVGGYTPLGNNGATPFRNANGTMLSPALQNVGTPTRLDFGSNPAMVDATSGVDVVTPGVPNLGFGGPETPGLASTTAPSFDFGGETNYGFNAEGATSGFNANTTDAIYNGGTPENSGFDFGLTPDAGAGDSFLSGIDFSAIGTAATGAAGLFSAYNGLQGNKLAKKQFGFEKQAWQQNFDQQLDAYNTRKTDSERVQRSHGVNV